MTLPLLRWLLVLGSLWVAVVPAQAQQIWKRADLLADMFPLSERIEPQVLAIDDTLGRQFSETLGYLPPATEYTFYVARTGEVVDGYVLFDDQVGQHEPITFAVQLTPTAVVIRHEVVVYREKYGDEVRHVRYRKQFVGKTSADEIEAGRDIRIVTGATYSSRAMAVGVRRAVFLTEQLLASEAARAAAVTERSPAP